MNIKYYFLIIISIYNITPSTAVAEEQSLYELFFDMKENNDQISGKKFIERVSKMVAFHCRGVISNAYQDDVLSKVLIDLTRASSLQKEFAKNFRAGKFSGYIRVIIKRRNIDILRRYSKHKVISVENSELDTHKNTAVLDTVVHDAEQSEEAEKIWQVMLQMHQGNPHAIEALRLYFYKDYSHQQISDAIQMPLGTVKTILRRSVVSCRNTFNLETPN